MNYPQLPCIYCSQPAKLVEGKITLQKGLIKTESPSNHYECTVCKRTFQTHEQKMQAEESMSKNRIHSSLNNQSTHLFEKPNEQDSD